MSVLPESLFSTYKKYKEDTRKVATWLAETAQSCGYNLQSTSNVTDFGTTVPHGTKLTGRARTLARRAKQTSEKTQRLGKGGEASALTIVIVSTSDFITFAEHITRQLESRVKVPAALIKVLETLISARRRCNAWFECHAKDEVDKQKNASHFHFIRILEATLAILTPYASKSNTTSPNHNSAVLVSAGDNFQGFTNIFEHLNIENLDDADFKVPVRPSAGKTSNSNGKVQTKIELKELHDKENLLFACFCMLQDLHNIQDYIAKLWARYKEHKVPLVVVSLTTNAAFELARQIENDFWRHFPDQQDYMKTFIQVYFNDACEARQQEVGNAFGIEGKYATLLVDEMADVSEWSYMPAWCFLRDLKSMIKGSREEAQMLVEKFRVADIESRSKQTDYQRTFWSNAMHCAYLLINTTACIRHTIETEDQFTKGLRQLTDAGEEVPLWLAFAAQVHCDIQVIMGPDLGSGLQQLHQMAVKAKAVIENRDAFLRYLQLPTPTTLYKTDKAQEILTAADDILNNTTTTFKDGRVLSHPSTAREMYGTNPLASGLRLFFLLNRIQYLSLRIVDSSGSILTSVHLYHALKKEEATDITWPDLEHVIDVHGARHIFVGEPPSTRAKYWRHHALALGSSIANFQQGGFAKLKFRTSGHRELLPGHSFLMRLFSAPLQRYGGIDLGIEDVALAVKALQGSAAGLSKIQQNADGSLSNRAELWKKLGKRAITSQPVHLLTEVTGCLLAEIPAIYFDYLGMDERCWRVLKAITEDLEYNGITSVDSISFAESSAVPTIVLSYLDEETVRQAHANGRISLIGDTIAANLLAITSKSMENCLSTLGSVGVQQIQSVHADYVPRSYLQKTDPST